MIGIEKARYTRKMIPIIKLDHRSVIDFDLNYEHEVAKFRIS